VIEMQFRRLPLSKMVAIAGLLLAGSGCADRADPPLPVPTAAQPCPQWTEFPADRHSNRDSPYLGCTNAMNLRSMVENPADLEHGRQLGPADGERETRAVEAYRQGKVKSGQGAGSAVPAIVMPGAGSASGQ
jgi:type IV pilus biogenesis protein CpaD/CtpE